MSSTDLLVGIRGNYFSSLIKHHRDAFCKSIISAGKALDGKGIVITWCGIDEALAQNQFP